jgi:hypothetical protein
LVGREREPRAVSSPSRACRLQSQWRRPRRRSAPGGPARGRGSRCGPPGRRRARSCRSSVGLMEHQVVVLGSVFLQSRSRMSKRTSSSRPSTARFLLCRVTPCPTSVRGREHLTVHDDHSETQGAIWARIEARYRDGMSELQRDYDFVSNGAAVWTSCWLPRVRQLSLDHPVGHRGGSGDRRHRHTRPGRNHGGDLL